jgi:transposase, IS5 family
MGGEPLLAVPLGDGTLRARAAHRPVEHEPLAKAGRASGSGGAFEGDDRGRPADGRHQAERAQACQRGHDRPGEAHPPPDGPEALRPDAQRRLVAAARREGVELRQSYVRVGKQLLARQSRYAHARQWGRARGCTRKLRTILGRVIRDVERKLPDPSERIGDLLALAKRLHRQQRHDKGKLYSVHAPEVECISKGKAHKRYEFGCKVALAVSSKGGWVLAAQALEGNPYDGHTLQDTMDRILSITGTEPEHAYVDTGYRGHDYEGGCEIHVGRRRRGAIAGSVWRWMRRRAAIEPSIGHLKEHRRMERCRLKGTLGDKVNSALSAAAMNFSKLLAALGALVSLLLARFVGLLAPRSSRGDSAAIAG